MANSRGNKENASGHDHMPEKFTKLYHKIRKKC
jgi:hypothetical protein